MMKKLFAILLCVLMVLSLAACGKEEVDTNPFANDGTVDGSGIANPWVEYNSLEEINEEVGCYLCTAGFMGRTDEHFAVCDMGEYKMAEYQFTLGGDRICFRCAPVTTDISGVNDETVQKAFAEPCGDTIETVITDTMKLARWLTLDGQYLLMIADNGEMGADAFEIIVDNVSQETIRNMVNANGENG